MPLQVKIVCMVITILYMCIFWLVIQEASVHRIICSRVFLSVLFVLLVLCAWRILALVRFISCWLVSFISWLHIFPSHLHKTVSLFLTPFLWSPLQHSVLCDRLLFYFFMCLLSVRVECKFNESKNSVCFVHLNI